MKIFCPVWGEKHIALLKNALGVSLSWPKNRKAINGAEWVIITESEAELYQISKILLSIGDFKVKEHFIPGISGPGVDTGQCLIPPLLETIQDCIDSNESMLMATPDFIYADGTVTAFKNIAFEPGSCAAIAHMRVLPGILKHLRLLPNEELMNIAYDFAHRSWAESPVNLYQGGVDRIEIAPHLTAVRHYMPSPFFVNFLPEDLDHFQEIHEGRKPGFGLWDHVWPTHLLNKGRLRFIGSSDAAMMIEVTDHSKNVPPIDFSHTLESSGFFRKHFHNEIQKQFVSIFRSSELHENPYETGTP